MRQTIYRTFFLTILFCILFFPGYSHQINLDTLSPRGIGPIAIKKDWIKTNSSSTKAFGFVTHVPEDIFQIIKSPFQKKNLFSIGIIGGSTAGLLFLDKPIINLIGNSFRCIGIQQKEQFHDFLEVKEMDILKFPGNINTFFYSLGRTTPTFLLAGGFYLFGKTNHNSRATRTAGELTESYLTSLIVVQSLKRITGRQSPNRATIPGGKWHWFPSLSNYSKDVTNYIAFPSGHMAAMMSAVTIIAENYPEKKWIRAIGYSLIGLTGLSMLNNKVHWASDFPLGLGIGYLSAKIVHHRNQKKEELKRSLLNM